MESGFRQDVIVLTRPGVCVCVDKLHAHVNRGIFQQLVMTIEYLHLRGLSGRSFDHTNILLAVRAVCQQAVGTLRYF
jgi:hypothetical protein